MPSPPLILASRSPRRVELLREAGFDFEAVPADIDEEQYPPDLEPEEVAEFLARGKATVIAEQQPAAVVLGADTVVSLGDALLGKPEDADHARWMLGQLAGSTHTVVTGVCVLQPGVSPAIAHRVSTVAMRPLEPAEIDLYIASGDWRGKAGGYGIQDRETVVTRIEGSLTNIVGLPMELVLPMLAAAGVMPVRPASPARVNSPR